jgi:hypothetical protein
MLDPLAGFAAPPATLPSQLLDLSNWKLTLPINAHGVPSGLDDATEVTQPALATFSDRYFKPNSEDEGVIFTAPIDGSRTSGSTYPRSELREMTDNGRQEASWSTTSGKHEMDLTESVDAMPLVKKQVVFAQIHGPSDDVFTAEANYSSLKGFWLDVNHNGSKWGYDVVNHYTLGTKFSLRIVASGGFVDVYYDGVHKVHKEVSSAGDYFKAGAYTQSNECTEAGLSSSCSSGGVDDHSVGQVTVYSLAIHHSA